MRYLCLLAFCLLLVGVSAKANLNPNLETDEVTEYEEPAVETSVAKAPEPAVPPPHIMLFGKHTAEAVATVKEEQGKIVEFFEKKLEQKSKHEVVHDLAEVVVEKIQEALRKSAGKYDAYRLTAAFASLSDLELLDALNEAGFFRAVLSAETFFDFAARQGKQKTSKKLLSHLASVATAVPITVVAVSGASMLSASLFPDAQALAALTTVAGSLGSLWPSIKAYRWQLRRMAFDKQEHEALRFEFLEHVMFKLQESHIPADNRRTLMALLLNGSKGWKSRVQGINECALALTEGKE